MSLPQTTAVLGDNGNNQGKPGGEGQLDLEYMMALAPGADTYYYSFSDLNPFNPGDDEATNSLPTPSHSSHILST